MTVPESIPSRLVRFSAEILRLYRVLRRDTDVPLPLANQLLDAGMSIGANASEAQSAYSRRELAFKYSVCLKEGRECAYWLDLLMVDQPRLKPIVDPLAGECGEIIAILTSTVRRLRGHARSGGP
jgi:four helix bundle protein